MDKDNMNQKTDNQTAPGIAREVTRIKMRLTIEVDYDATDAQYLKEQLERLPRIAASEGWLSGDDPDTTVNTWRAYAEQL